MTSIGRGDYRTICLHNVGIIKTFLDRVISIFYCLCCDASLRVCFCLLFLVYLFFSIIHFPFSFFLFCCLLFSFVRAASCLADQFRCSSSGFCIPSNQKCDGIVDCPDRDDEVDCATPPPPGFVLFFSLFLFVWRAFYFFHFFRLPSFLQRPKNSNLIEFCATVCTEYQFRCRDGTCLDSRRRCDARYDCPDESDEEDCGKFHDFLSCAWIPPPKKKITWTFDGQYGNQSVESSLVWRAVWRVVWVPFSRHEITNMCRRECWWMLNNKTGSSWSLLEGTEADRKRCRPTEFACDLARCIESAMRCDNFYDCIDLSDELNCTGWQSNNRIPQPNSLDFAL